MAVEPSNWTALQDEKEFREMLEIARPRVALEIGTFQGISTALIAEYADVVITVDCFQDWIAEQEMLWRDKGVRGKIASHCVKNTKDKSDLINSIPFDFAFIDGDHFTAGIQLDFDLTKRCGNLLFHDYYPVCARWPQGGWNDVKLFVDALPGEKIIKAPFALWQNNLYGQ